MDDAPPTREQRIQEAVARQPAPQPFLRLYDIGASGWAVTHTVMLIRAQSTENDHKTLRFTQGTGSLSQSRNGLI
jgi:hypothetical protein